MAIKYGKMFNTNQNRCNASREDFTCQAVTWKIL